MVAKNGSKKVIRQLQPNRDDLFQHKHPSLWKFWEHGVSSSFLNLFMTCREQTRLAFVEGWTSKMNGLPIEFGSCVHWVLEQAYGQFNDFRHYIKNPTTVKNWVKEYVENYQTDWLKKIPRASNAQVEFSEVFCGLAEAVLPTYFRRWDGDFLQGKYTFGNQTPSPAKWESLEELFQVSYTFLDGKNVPIRGRRDGVFLDGKGNRWVFDTKTKSIIRDDEISELLPWDLQQMLYLYVTHRSGPVAGTVMNVVRRPGQRRGNDERLKDFLNRVAAEVCATKNFDHYFIRYVMKGPDIKEFERNMLRGVMRDVRAWWEGDVAHYRNPSNLTSKYGKCGLYEIIVNKLYSSHYQRKAAFNELPEVK